MNWTRGRWTAVSLLLATPVTFLALAICAFAQVATTTVTDTIYQANGQKAQGSVIVTWPAFTTATGQAVAAGSSTATLDSQGVLTMTLTPNAGATPMGTYYTAVYHLNDGSVNREYWVVPASASAIHLSAIRSTVLPTSVAMQTVSKSYVDTAIAAAVAGTPLDSSNPYVLKAGDTMTGPLALAGDPTSPAQASTKSYVDTSIAAVAGGLGQRVATLPQGTQTVTQPTGTELQVNHQNGVLYARQYQAGGGNNGIGNAVSSADCASGCEVRVDQAYAGNENYTPSTWPSGTHVEDARRGGRRDSYVDPDNVVGHGIEAGQAINVTSTKSSDAIHQITGTHNPYSVGLLIEHNGLAGGSNQFPEGIGTAPYFKMTYNALSLKGTYNTQGQHVLAPNEVNCYGVGDCLIGSRFLLASGGQRDSADEGAHPFDLQIHEDSRVFTGTCTSGCTPGSTAVTISATSGTGTQGDGRFLIDTSSAKTITNGTLIGGDRTTPHTSALFNGTSFPVSTFFRLAASVPPQSDQMAPGTVTVAIATTGLPAGYASSTAAAPASSGVACVADPLSTAGATNDFETANYTVVDGTHLQLTLNKAHFLNATVAIGGLCGYGLEQTVDTTSGIRQVFPVVGSQSSTALMYTGHASEIVGVTGSTSAYANIAQNITSVARSNNTVTLTTAGNMPYDLNGLTVQITGITDSSYNGSFTVTSTGGNTLTYTQSGSNSTSTGGTLSVLTGGYVLYPMAEVLSVLNPATKAVDGQMTLAPNTVNWATSDSVEQPHYHQEKVGPDIEFVGQYMPRPESHQNAGIQYEGNNGPGLRGWSITNTTPATNYYGNGGTHQFPDLAYQVNGVWRRDFDAQAGEQSVFSIHCNSRGCGRWNSAYNLFELDSNVGIDVINYNPLTSTLSWNLRGAGYSLSPQAFNAGTINATTINATTLNGTISAAQLPVFGGSGATHAKGAVPDPGATAGTSRYLREDGTWNTPSGSISGTSVVGTVVSTGALADYDFMQGSGSVLTDKSGNGNNGTLGTSTRAPSWTTQGLYMAGGTNVSLPATLNNSRTVIAALYINPITTQYPSGAAVYPSIITSSMGGTGLNLLMSWSRNINGSSLISMSSFTSGVVTGTNNRFTGFHVLAYTLGSASDSTYDRFYIDGIEVGDYTVQGRSAGVQTTGNLFLGASGTAPWTGGANQTMYRMVTYSSALSAADILAASNAIRTEVAARGVSTTPSPTPLTVPYLHGIGDSIMAGLGITTPWLSSVSLTGAPTFTTKNWGISGLAVAEALGAEPNRVAPYCKTVSGVPSVALVHIGTNDLTSFSTPEQTFADLAGEVQTLKRAGCTVFVATMLSRSGSSTGTGTPTMESQKQAYNALITRRYKEIGADGLIDFAANPLLGADGASTNTTNFQDGIHPTQVGAGYMATAASNSLNYYFGYNLANPNTVTAATYAMTSGDGAVTAAPTANAAYTLPDCTGPSGAVYTISNPQSAYMLTIQGQTNQPINGLTTAVAVPSNSTVTLHDVPNARSASGCHWVM